MLESLQLLALSVLIGSFYASYELLLLEIGNTIGYWYVGEIQPVACI
jgi:hypothetical protein